MLLVKGKKNFVGLSFDKQQNKLEARLYIILKYAFSVKVWIKKMYVLLVNKLNLARSDDASASYNRNVISKRRNQD